ncbi:FtsX-like permease family protein [Maribacter algarum]|uniref:FtsX-like permease family protein n=1 Tax=Maribacter algarum (ex Zhang et al. 2020) TaxID=2578118 RepID=A0A5S3PDT4_9FLAO|nr:ABC transporter permease [Maribacter algarum]TMM52132.1 FtsX-like permease family protein [Maribacter algarum]
MFKNYLKIAWRNLWKNKGYSALNIFGLAIGITCASLILLWVEDEVSFDSVFPKYDQVYYVPTNNQFDGEWRTFYESSPGPLAKAMKDEIPGIVGSSRTMGESLLFTMGDKGINRYGRFVDPDFLSIFSLSFVEGSLANAFKDFDAIVISSKMAAQLYGQNTSALGKVILVNNDTNYRITGVFEDLPSNVSFGFNWVAPFERHAIGKEWMKDYRNGFADTFVELSPEADFETVDSKVQKLIPSKVENDPSERYAFLHPMKDWHLRSSFKNGKKVGGQITNVRLFALIGIIILLIACINFMNLSTARSEKRGKEVGVRKVLGSGKKRLITQFIAEAMITAAMATIVSVVLLTILLPQFNTLIEKQLEFRLFDPIHLLSLLGITLICGLLAGWYPAFYLSSFKPIAVIKGVKAKGGSATIIRKGLVVAQFVVSIIFIISTIIIYQQLQHVKNRDLGYQKENLLRMDVNGDIIKNIKPIRQEMIASGVIEKVALMNSNILDGGNNRSGLEWEGGKNTEEVLVSQRYISSDFFDTAGIEIIEGHGFNENFRVDSTNVLVTQSFAKLMGPGSALGKIIRNDEDTYTVIGVVKDYLYGDMYGTSDPVMFYNNPKYTYHVYVKVKPDIALAEILPIMKGVMKKHNPAFPFEYDFVNDSFNSMFRSEKLIGNLSKIFALLAIIISCLGLFGLSAFTAEQRRKEIGVRKVLGSSVAGIVQLLSKDFIRLVLIALLVAIPLAWWGMQNWLESFAYRIEINWSVFAVAGFAAICIAMLTVSFQAVKAAVANPVKSLRTE